MNRFQQLLCLGTALIAFPFSWRLVQECITYASLSAQTPAHILQWEIEEVSDRFALRATYSFEVQEKTYQKTYQGTSRLPPPYSLNQNAALATLREQAKLPLTVWYHPKNPSLSSLHRTFPTSLLFRAITCYVVLFYFLLSRRKFDLIQKSS